MITRVMKIHHTKLQICRFYLSEFGEEMLTSDNFCIRKVKKNKECEEETIIQNLKLTSNPC